MFSVCKYAQFATNNIVRSTAADSFYHIRIRSLTQALFSTKIVNAKVPRIILDEKDLTENFIKGTGPGGQKINKRCICVQLTHVPTGISVTCQEFRDLTTNRKRARHILRDKIDFSTNGSDSKLGKRHDKIRRRKAKNAR